MRKKWIIGLLVILIVLIYQGKTLAASVSIITNTKEITQLRKKERVVQNNNEKVSQRIVIDKSQIKDEEISQITDSFARPSSVLIDEQEKLPSAPESNFDASGIDSTTWNSYGVGKTASCYIDLKKEYVITHIGFKDTFGNPELVFKYGKPFNWTVAFTQKMDSYNQWKLIDVASLTTRYLQIVVKDGKDSGISEIALYGYPIGEEEENKQKAIRPNFGTTVDQSVGMNAFIDDPLDILKVVGTIREYHNFSWTLDKANENKFNPSYVSVWNFDKYYEDLYKAGVTVMPCIQGTTKAIVGNLSSKNQKPLKQGADSLNPMSYAAHASTMFQYAARYGTKKVDENKLLLADNQEKKTGLGYIKYYENWNEPDKTWEGEKSYFSPYELAAMCSADYDGHEKTMGDTYGVKNADSDAKLVLGGVCNSKNFTKYLDLMKFWAENNRTDKKLPFDVINFHMYTGTNCPEQSDFQARCEEIVAWRDENASDKEVWLTEFGWDTNEASPLTSGTKEAQRDWLIRGYLIANRAGIERTTMYMVRDTGNETETGKYGTSGLTTKKGEWNKKPSWYGVYTLKNTLAGYQFKEVVKEEETIRIYRYIKEDTDEECYAIWSPTQNGSYLDNYILPIQNREKATLITLKDGSETGEQSNLPIHNQTVSVKVTESPVFVKVSGNKPEDNKPEDNKPEDNKPEDNKPEDNKPEDNKPEDNKPEDNKPEDNKPEDNKPEDNKPDDSKPDDNKPEDNKPEDNKPEDNKPDDSKPDDSKPDDSKPDDNKPDDSTKAPSYLPKTGKVTLNMAILVMIILLLTLCVLLHRKYRKTKK